MKKQIILLSGWGQKFDSLEFIFDFKQFSDYQLISLDYSLFDNVADFFDYVKSRNLNPEIVIGWSLGGQLSLRLIQENILLPKSLILIAPPFQMVKNLKIQAAMSQKKFTEFYENFKKAPNDVLKKFSVLMVMNDKNAKEIAKNLDFNEKNHKNLIFWLEELKRFSFFEFDFEKIPKTLHFHGKGDMIVHILQEKYFKEKIQDFDSVIFSDCGHAPHLSDLGEVRENILRFIF